MLSFPAVLPTSSSAADDKSSSANLNIHGESPPPKEIPDMSSATFVSVGGDKLTLALGSNNNKNISGSPTSPPTSTGHGGGSPGSPPMDKLINLDSPTSNTSAG